MTRLWLVRHGPTHAKTLIGRTDRPADLTDRAALDRLHAALPPAAPILGTGLRRTEATADALARGRPRLAPEPGLREFDYGAWEDQPFAAFDGPLSRRFFEDPGVHRPPGGESWNDVRDRAVAALRAYEDWPELVAVAHFGTILVLWAHVADVAPKDALARNVAPLSLTRLDWGAGARAHFVGRAL